LSCQSARIPENESLAKQGLEVFKNWTKYNDTFYLQHHYFPNGTYAIKLWEKNVTSRSKTSSPSQSKSYIPNALKDFSPNIPDEPELNWNYAFTVIIVVGVLLIVVIIGGLALLFGRKKLRGHQINITNLLGNQEQVEERQKKAEKMQNI